MDNNNEKTDRLFRERLSVYEEMPDDQVWDKIASRMAVEKRSSFIYFILRIAAGMTLLASLGLGYHLVYKSGNQKPEAVITKPSSPEKSAIAASAGEKTLNNSNNQSVIPAVKSDKNESELLKLNDRHTNLYNTSKYNTSNTSIYNTSNTSEYNASNSDSYTAFNSEKITSVPTSLTMREVSLFPVPVPHRLGYRRLSKEDMQEQTAALTADINEDITDEDSKDNRWMLGSEVAPLYSYRKIESDYLDKSVVQDMNKAEQGLIAYAGGFRVGYNAGRRLSVQSGLYYSRYGQEKNNGEAVSLDQIAYTDKKNVKYLSIPNSTGTIQANNGNTSHFESVISTSNGTNKADFLYNGFPAISTGVPQVEEGGITAIQYFDYLELPVTVKYKIIDRKLSFSFLGGLITNFLVNNGVQLKQNGNVESFGTTRDINKVNYQGAVGLGFDYPLMDRLSISLEPRFRYYLNPIDQRFNVHPYSFGLFAGISYTLK